MEAISAQGNDVPDAIIIQGRISAVRAGALTRGNLGCWAYLYNRYLGTCLPSKIYLVGGTVSYPYFNAGLVSFDQDTGFGNSWLDLACQIDYDPKVKDKRPWLDQIVLPIAAYKSTYRDSYPGVFALEEKYNYNPDQMKDDESAICVYHYHAMARIYRNKLNGEISSLLSKMGIEKNFYELTQMDMALRNQSAGSNIKV